MTTASAVEADGHLAVTPSVELRWTRAAVFSAFVITILHANPSTTRNLAIANRPRVLRTQSNNSTTEMTFKVHSMLMKMVPFESLGTIFYSHSITTMPFYVPILYRFRDKSWYWSKIAIFSYPLHATPPLWVPSEYCHTAAFELVLQLLIPQNILLFRYKHCLFPNLPFLFIRQHKLWNDAHLRIATVTCFSWYFGADTTVF